MQAQSDEAFHSKRNLLEKALTLPIMCPVHRRDVFCTPRQTIEIFDQLVEALKHFLTMKIQQAVLQVANQAAHEPGQLTEKLSVHAPLVFRLTYRKRKKK